MKQLNFDIFRNAMGFSSAIFPTKQIVFDAGIKKGQSVMLYGEISKLLIKETLKAIGKTGTLYIIGRDSALIKYGKFTRGKYKNQVIVNPFFENIEENSLNLILIVNATINKNTIPQLAIHAKKTIRDKGEIGIIADNTTWEELIALSDNIPWLSVVPHRKILTFQKQITDK